jgi:hypothetical protein
MVMAMLKAMVMQTATQKAMVMQTATLKAKARLPWV